jgi:PleD family two-component response regulator
MAEKKVLVIDDSIMIRKMVKSILADRYEVIEASDGKSGIEAVRQFHPDLILLDFVMPKIQWLSDHASYPQTRWLSAHPHHYDFWFTGSGGRTHPRTVCGI